MKLLTWAIIGILYAAVAGALAALAGWHIVTILVMVLVVFLFVIVTGSLCCAAAR